MEIGAKLAELDQFQWTLGLKLIMTNIVLKLAWLFYLGSVPPIDLFFLFHGENTPNVLSMK